jgi:hypothetical protein
MFDQESIASRTWAGMNIRQIGLLGGLGVANCLVICVGIALLADPLSSALSASNASEISTSEPTATFPAVLPSLTPTITKTPIGGWHEVRGQGLALMLPSSFIGGNPAADSAPLRDELSSAGLDMTKVDPLFSHQPPYRLIAFDLNNATSGPAFLLIASDPGTASTPVDQYINLILQKNADDFFYLDRTTAWLDNYSAIRYTVESKTDRTVRQYQYFLQDEQFNFWVIVYSSPIAHFAEHLSDFELSIMTFRLLPALPPISGG